MAYRPPLVAARYAPPQEHLPGVSCLITLALAGAVPTGTVAALRAELHDAERAAPTGPGGDPARHLARKRYFAAWDAALDTAATLPGAYALNLLRSSAVARAIRTELHRAAEQQQFGLLAYCILPNHVHLLLRLPPPQEAIVTLTTALHRLKARTAQQANRLLGRSGEFWEAGHHELHLPDTRVPDTSAAPNTRVVDAEADAEVRRAVAYIRQQPVALGLVPAATPELWPHLHVAADFWWQ